MPITWPSTVTGLRFVSQEWIRSGVRGRRARDLLVDGRLTAADDTLAYGLERRPQCRNDLRDRPADLVLDSATVDRSEHRVDAQESELLGPRSRSRPIPSIGASPRSTTPRASRDVDSRRLSSRRSQSACANTGSVRSSTPPDTGLRTGVRVADGAGTGASTRLGPVEALIGVVEEPLARRLGVIEGGEADAHGDPGLPFGETTAPSVPPSCPHWPDRSGGGSRRTRRPRCSPRLSIDRLALRMISPALARAASPAA